MYASRTSHLDVVTRILRYLKGTLGKGIWIKNNNSNNVCGYSNINWVRSFDRKITTGFLHICERKYSHLEEQKAESGSTLKREGGISS
jgi:hypothetical protein